MGRVVNPWERVTAPQMALVLREWADTERQKSRDTKGYGSDERRVSLTRAQILERVAFLLAGTGNEDQE